MRRGLRQDGRGATALEYAIVAPVFLAMMLGMFEYGRMIWTTQSLQLATAQAARCVAIGSTACSSGGAAYAATIAQGFGVPLTAASVTVTNTPGSVSNQAICSPPGGTTNAFTQVLANFSFTSAVGSLVPGLTRTLTIASCYPLTGS